MFNRCPICNSEEFENMFEGWVRCIKCRVVYNRQRQLPNYTQSDWTLSSVDPDGKLRNILEEREDKLKNWYGDDISYVNKLKPGRILDIGCGPGFFLSAIDERWEKHGIEPSSQAAEYAKSINDINVISGRLEDANYPKGFFDIVYVYHVIEHLSDPKAMLKEVNRIVKLGGRLIVGTPNIDSFCARRFKQNFRLLQDPGHIILFGSHTLCSLLKAYGFQVGKIKYPFFRTKYFTMKNLLRLFDTSKVSPPFYGNIMTAYAIKEREI
ncbi:Ubiquinone biosynthesis O-methyltransferase [subsurface metagenome]